MSKKTRTEKILEQVKVPAPSSKALLACQSKNATREVLGTLLLKPQKLLEGQYRITLNDFIEPLYQIIFLALSQMARKGYQSCDVTEFEEFLKETTPTKYKTYCKYNGGQYLEQATYLCNPDNYIVNCIELKKYSMLREYMKEGIDISEFYNPDEPDSEVSEAIIERFKLISLDKLGAFYQTKLLKINNRYSTAAASQGRKAGGDAAKAQKEKWKDGISYGLSYASNFLTDATDGLQLGRYIIMSGGTNVGKAIPNNTIIPTPIGNRMVGDIKPGDYLFGKNGKPTKVLQIHPQPEDKQVWVVEFEDGRKAQCCKDHLWEVYYKTHKEGKRYVSTKTLTTEEMYTALNTLGQYNRGYRYHIPKNDAVEYSEKQYSIDPYVFGLMLGDGSFREHPSNKAIQFSSSDAELPQYIANTLHLNLKKSSDNNYTWYFQNNEGHNYTVSEFLAEYPELINAYSYDKYIPVSYLEGSIAQRWELLRGLLDTDGHIDTKHGNISINTVSQALKDDIVTLCNSLGLITTIYEDKRDKYTNGICYTIRLRTTLEEKTKCFKLARKTLQVQEYLSSCEKCIKSYPKHHIGIVKVYPTNEYTAMTCFTVEADDHLFLMNDFIVTHNTRITIANIAHTFAKEFWDEKTKTWMTNPNGTQNRVLYIGTEQELTTEIEPVLEAYIANVPQEHIQHPQFYEEGEEARVDKAIEILSESNIYMEYLPEYCLASLEEVIARYVFEAGVTHVFFDYIHSTTELIAEYKSLTAGGLDQVREDQVLTNVSNKLKDWARKYNICIYTSTQLNGDLGNTDIRDQRLLRGSKAIADKADVCGIISQVTEAEQRKIEPYLREHAQRYKLICLSLYKNRVSGHKDIKIWLDIDYRTMRVHDLFTTTYEYKPYNDLKPVVVRMDEDTNKIFFYKNMEAMRRAEAGELEEEVHLYDDEPVELPEDVDLNEVDEAELDQPYEEEY